MSGSSNDGGFWDQGRPQGDRRLALDALLAGTIVLTAFFPWVSDRLVVNPRYALDDASGIMALVFACAVLLATANRSYDSLGLRTYAVVAVGCGIGCAAMITAHAATVLGSCAPGLADGCSQYGWTPLGFVAVVSALGMMLSSASISFRS